ncbi:hypothetical protein ACLF3G_27610 [Falsiroseomonas sp. HC035]|uniref:hypothetical protein n=1 Tax=Falsiroseomonas sp. HC035 TaxID=3390999 RepID=UPI003D31B3FF
MKPQDSVVPDADPDPPWLLIALVTHLQAEIKRVNGAEAKLLDAVRQAAAAEGEAVALRRQVKASSQRATRIEAEREAAREELAAWRQGGPLARVWRAFWRR